MNSDNLGCGRPTFRARLRFRVQKKINIESKEHRFSVAGHEIVLSPLNGEAIRESDWLVMNATGFCSADDAGDFGHKLRSALDLSSVATRLGIDTGRDLATSGLGALVKDRIAQESGAIIRDNVHGLDVFEDDPNVRFFQIAASGSILASADPFLPFVAELHAIASIASERAKDVILLMNYALMRPEPVAQIVFAFSAVEMLGQNENWTRDQELLLEELATSAELSSIGTVVERTELAEAIRKSTHRLSLRQGVLRLLDRLELRHLRATWDAIYGERSGLVHGLAPKAGADYSDLANRVLNLCGHILLRAIAAELPMAGTYAEKYFPVPDSRNGT